MPFVSRTRATLRRAEFGFFGVTVITRVQTPRFWGQFCRAGAFVFLWMAFRPIRTSWLIVGIDRFCSLYPARDVLRIRRSLLRKGEFRKKPPAKKKSTPGTHLVSGLA